MGYGVDEFVWSVWPVWQMSADSFGTDRKQIQKAMKKDETQNIIVWKNSIYKNIIYKNIIYKNAASIRISHIRTLHIRTLHIWILDIRKLDIGSVCGRMLHRSALNGRGGIEIDRWIRRKRHIVRSTRRNSEEKLYKKKNSL